MPNMTQWIFRRTAGYLSKPSLRLAFFMLVLGAVMLPVSIGQNIVSASTMKPAPIAEGTFRKLDQLRDQYKHTRIAVERAKVRKVRLQNIAICSVLAALIPLIILLVYRYGSVVKGKHSAYSNQLEQYVDTEFLSFPDLFRVYRKDITISVVSLIFALVVAEISLRVLNTVPQEYSTWSMNVRSYEGRHFERGYFDVAVRTNVQGLREDKTITQKDPDVFRIALVGDSMTFGWGVEKEENLASHLQTQMDARFGKNKIEVVNFSIPGTGPYQYHRYVDRYVREVGADLNVVNVLMGNDTHMPTPLYVMGALQALNIVMQMKSDSKKQDKYYGIADRESLLWHSALYRFMIVVLEKMDGIDYQRFGAMWQGPEASTQGHKFNAPSVDNAAVETNLKSACQKYVARSKMCQGQIEEHLEGKISHRFYADLKEKGIIEKACRCSGNNPADIENKIIYAETIDDLITPKPDAKELFSQIDGVFLQLQEIRKAGESFGAKVIFNFLPQGWHVDLRSMKGFELEHLYVPEFLTMTVERDYVLKRAHDFNIDAISPLDELRKYSDHEVSPYIIGDYHPSSFGHEITAKWLLRQLEPILRTVQ